MGHRKFWQVVVLVVLFCGFLSQAQHVQGEEKQGYNRGSLDDFVHDYAFKKMRRPRTGRLYDVPLPANFSGMEVSFVRIRRGSFWAKGANFSFFHIPPRILAWPFTRRLDIVYQNLGNLSSYYYNLPNYTFVAPVIGFLVYDSNRSSRSYRRIELSLMGDPIQVHFPHVSHPPEAKNGTMRCVRFDANGAVEFSNMTTKNSCIANGQGHFSVVIPTLPAKKKKQRLWKWWAIGFGVGIAGLVLFVVFGVIICKIVRLKRIEKMESQSERSEALDTVWVGRSRMPSAAGIRTQPVLETSYVP